MTQAQESVVTRERFDAGMDWKTYLAQIQRNIPKFEFNYNETTVPAEAAARLKSLAEKDNGPKRVLVLGEDWCPDVFRGLPVFVRMAEAGGWDLRIFPRDDNLDIMNEFLNQGEHQSIPTAVFYTGDHEYIAHWIERPQKAEDEMGEYRSLFEGLDREKDHQEMRRRNDEFQTGPTWASWRDATIDEVTALLEAKCG
ncbi:MAG TPA: thioredoxin family protein [Dehalococcoidia bacterium]|nr:thioredoxin family protein [Dehalococcoidia bacterium]